MAKEDQDKTVLVDDRATSGAASSRPATPCLAHSVDRLPDAVYWLSSGKELAIGRAEDNDVCIPDPGVSQHHARVGVTAEGAIFIEDLGSTNGTYVNGEKIARQTLRDGDKVLIRPNFVLKFCYRLNPAPETAGSNGTDASRDVLTGLYAKHYLLMRIDEDFFRAKTRNEDVALLMFEVDHFEKIAETHEPAAGELVLREVAKVVSSVLGREDIFARYENHTFGALLRNRADAAAVVLAQRVRRSVKYHSFLYNGEKIQVTASLGIGFFAQNMKSPMDFFSEALSNLAKARRAGRDTINGSKSLRTIVSQIADKNVA
ncbi:MAG TPA: GGDEF domain-containing protein [Pseudolabrys sp.]|nr:GGDEF domain-containing protein [Pseudolabrys sp.]